MTGLPEIPAQKLSILKTQTRGLESIPPPARDVPARPPLGDVPVPKVCRHSLSLA